MDLNELIEILSECFVRQAMIHSITDGRNSRKKITEFKLNVLQTDSLYFSVMTMTYIH